MLYLKKDEKEASVFLHLRIFGGSLFLLADMASKWLLNAAGLFYSSTQSFPTALAHSGHTYLSFLEKASICSNRRKTLNMLLLVMNLSEQHGDAYQFLSFKTIELGSVELPES